MFSQFFWSCLNFFVILHSNLSTICVFYNRFEKVKRSDASRQ
ncbi:MAG: hypothetical protein K2M31_09065 [Muribaculaceae bacterium]|nr:hypothetical protein [Muribaculaceae bacterium]